MDRRRSVRFFSDDPVPRECIEYAIRIAGTAPSGAHMQPWTWVVIDDPELKREIRVAAEREEYESYEGGRMPPEWRKALAPLGTDWHKPFLETVPYIVICFGQAYGLNDDGSKRKHYYVQESVGISCGFFIAGRTALDGARDVDPHAEPDGVPGRAAEAAEEREGLRAVPVGYPAADATVPDLTRKPLDQIMQRNRG